MRTPEAAFTRSRQFVVDEVVALDVARDEIGELGWLDGKPDSRAIASTSSLCMPSPQRNSEF